MSKFFLRGVCPVCGRIITSFNPPLSMITNSEAAKRQSYLDHHFPQSVWGCYHNGTIHHVPVFSVSSRADVPMHLFYTETNQRVYTDASDDCNRRHWKVPKVI